MLKPWLWIPAKLAHDLSPHFLKLYGLTHSLQTLTWQPRSWRGHEFTNPLGIAGGVDKNAEQVEDWWTLGPGFIEIGTVTPQPQEGLSGKTMGRDLKQKAIWNRMGFPSQGVEKVKANLTKLYKPHFTPVIANVGKNRTTPNQNAHQDYIYCIEQLHGLVEGFVINISSPNTAGLRDLLEPENLKNFLQPVVSRFQELNRNSQSRPLPFLLLKLSPDMTQKQLEQVIRVSNELSIDGWVVTNTTTDRAPGLCFPQEGGVSGQPLQDRSIQTLKDLVSVVGPELDNKLIISVGGVLTPEQVFERLSLGADLVQVYSALIFQGPFFFRQVAEFQQHRDQPPPSERIEP